MTVTIFTIFVRGNMKLFGFIFAAVSAAPISGSDFLLYQSLQRGDNNFNPFLFGLFNKGDGNNGGLFGNIDLPTAMLLSNGNLGGMNMNNLMSLNLLGGNQVTSDQMVALSALNAAQIDKNVFSRYNQK